MFSTIANEECDGLRINDGCGHLLVMVKSGYLLTCTTIHLLLTYWRQGGGKVSKDRSIVARVSLRLIDLVVKCREKISAIKFSW